MSDSKNRIGFSTGALERGDFLSAIKWLHKHKVRSVELSALRVDELEPLVNALDALPTGQFEYVSFHAPSSFPKAAESWVVGLLGKVAKCGWNIIVHPDVIRTPRLWKPFNSHLLIENMDRRKAVGRTVAELDEIFKVLPGARLCLDLAHARQLDTTLTLLKHLINRYSNRIAQLHISELDSRCQHQPMSCSAVSDYKKFAGSFKATLPVIIESMLDGDRNSLRMDEFRLTNEALHPVEDGRNIFFQHGAKSFNATSGIRFSLKAQSITRRKSPRSTAPRFSKKHA
jgi:hypothetical protein